MDYFLSMATCEACLYSDGKNLVEMKEIDYVGESW